MPGGGWSKGRFVGTLIAVASLAAALPGASQSADPSATVADDPNKLLILLGSLTKQQRFDDALPVAERLVQISEQRSGPKHPDTALTLMLLASVHRSKGDFARAEPLFQRSYEIHQTLTPDGPKTVPPLLNLGIVVKQRGDEARALGIYRRALAILEKAYGPSSPELFQPLHALEQWYLDRKDNAGAAPWFERELAIILRANGETSEKAADGWFRVARLYEAYDWRKAVNAREHLLAIQERLRPSNDPAIIETLDRLAQLHRTGGELQKSAHYFERLVTLYEAATPRDPERLSVYLNRLGMVYMTAHDYARAQAAFERALGYDEQMTPRDEHEIAIGVSNLAEAALQNGDYRRAEELRLRALKTAEGGGDQRAIALATYDLAELHGRLGRFDSAESEYLRARALMTRAGRLETKDGGLILDGLASMYVDKGDYEKAQPLYEQAVAIARQTEGPSSADYASGLNNLGRLHMLRGDLAGAEGELNHALGIFTKLYGPSHPQVATVLNNLGSLAKEAGDYAKAKTYFQQALEMETKALAGPTVLADIQTNLGWAYLNLGDYQRAEQYYTQALTAFQRAFGPDHFKVGMALNNLGTLYESRGDSARAEPLLARAFAIAEKQPGSPQAATSLLNLAATYDQQNDFKRAEPLARRALAELERSLGPEHPGLRPALLALASIRAAQDDLKGAETLLRRGIALGAGPGGGEVLRLQASLADVLARSQQHELARPLYARALAGYTKVFGADHPDLAKLLVSLGVSYWATDDVAQALEFIRRGSDMREREVTRMIASGSEEQRRAFLQVSEFEATAAITLSTSGFPSDVRARRLALLEVLRRKGRVLDAMSDTTRVLREHLAPQDRALFDRLKTLRADVARRTLAGPAPGANADEHGRALEALERDADTLEAKISERSAEFRSAAQPVTLESVTARLPAKTALVELSSYFRFDPKTRASGKAWGARRYAAFVLHPDGRIDYADLGERAPIDALVGQFRTALDGRSESSKSIGQALHQHVVKPILPLLGDAQQVLLAPDGDLALIPFAALLDEQQRYLIDRWAFSYLSSGRDLLRTEARTSRTAPLVVANPAFSSVGRTATTLTRSARAFELAKARFEPLPGTEEEGRAILASLRGASFLSGADATTGAISGVHGPRVLHIATHGFFLDGSEQRRDGTRALVLSSLPTQARSVPAANPLLRSGLAFSGANLHRADDDGILTALEASSLDLWGTRLVVLSACETGVGEVKNGEGVYGLRRALVLAGAESLVMSLWKVDDAATRDLMIAYYRNLEAGQGRFDALRAAQRALMQKPAYNHPHFWASFVGYGATGPLGADAALPSALKGARPAPPAVAPSARGCACRSAGGAPHDARALLVALGLGGLLAGRSSARRRPAD